MICPISDEEIEKLINAYVAKGEKYLRRSGAFRHEVIGNYITWYLECEMNFPDGEKKSGEKKDFFKWQGKKYYFVTPQETKPVSTWKPCLLRLGLFRIK